MGTVSRSSEQFWENKDQAGIVAVPIGNSDLLKNFVLAFGLILLTIASATFFAEWMKPAT